MKSRRQFLTTTAAGLGMACFHPGSAGDSSRSASARRVGDAITRALETIAGDTRLLVENTAGAGNTMGRTGELHRCVDGRG